MLGSNTVRSIPKQLPHRVILHRDVQVGGCDRHIRVPGGVAGLSKRSAPGERVANKSVPPVVNRQRLQPLAAQHLARRPEPAPFHFARSASVPESHHRGTMRDRQPFGAPRRMRMWGRKCSTRMSLIRRPAISETRRSQQHERRTRIRLSRVLREQMSAGATSDKLFAVVESPVVGSRAQPCRPIALAEHVPWHLPPMVCIPAATGPELVMTRLKFPPSRRGNLLTAWPISRPLRPMWRRQRDLRHAEFGLKLGPRLLMRVPNRGNCRVCCEANVTQRCERRKGTCHPF